MNTVFSWKAAVSKEHGFAEDEIQIEDLTIGPGSKVGEGFVCEIKSVQFIAVFNGEKIKKNYIAKYAPEGQQGDFVREVHLLISHLLWKHLKFQAIKKLEFK